jgi:hypothetical protein
MENNNIQTKVNRIGKAGRIVSIILIVLLSIGAFSLLLAGGVCAVLPEDTVEVSFRPNADVLVGRSILGQEWSRIDEIVAEAQEALTGKYGEVIQFEKTDRGLLIRLDRLMEEGEVFRLRNALGAIWAGLVGIASAIVALVMFLKLSDAFRVCRSPFDEAVIRRMNIFAWTLIVCAVVGSFAGSAAQSAVMAFQNAGIHVGAKNFGVSLDLYPIFAALIVFFLCMVFRYGAQLQKEADETL